MSDQGKSNWRAWHYFLLWAIVIFSLTLNIILIVNLLNFAKRAEQEITKIDQTLGAVQLEQLEVPISIDETLPLNLTIPFNDTFLVPIQAEIPIVTTIVVDDRLQVPINETVRIDRDITVAVVILGQRIPVDIPIRADIPIALNLDVPVNLEVPVETTIPIDLMVEVPVNTEVPINTEVPVQLDFPVTIPLENLGIGPLLNQILDSFRAIIGVETDSSGT